jgi:hypothetical protein
MARKFQTHQIPTEFPTGVLTCYVVLPHAQRVNKHFERSLTLPAVVASADSFDTDAVELAPDHFWISNVFRIYQWRLDPLGVSVEPWEVAHIHFHRASWEVAHGLCHTLISSLNMGPMTETARQIVAYATDSAFSK